MKDLIIVCVFTIHLFNLSAQNTQEKGTVFLGGGIGKSFCFSPSIDNQTIKISSSLKDDFFLPQWMAKFGYVFTNHFAFELNADRFHWIYKDVNSLSNDLLYTRIGVFGMDKIFKTKKSKFAATWLLGLGCGPVFSNNKYDSVKTRFQTNDFNGFGGTFQLGIRFEFYKRLFFLVEQTGGLIYQSIKGENVKIELYQPYLRTNFSLGVFIYERWKESCYTCPKW